jgi:hypothetical protein
MTFLGGPRACIGYQFSIMESVQYPSSPPTFPLRQGPNNVYSYRMKCALFAHLRTFEFSLAVPAEDIVWVNNTLVRRPHIKGAEEEGPNLPLYIKLHIPDA